MDNKNKFMKKMMSLFYDNNPWKKKVIHIMAIYSTPNDQIAFWRMRFAKNLSKASISAENTIKLNKFNHIMNTIIQKNKTYGYWKINAHSENTQSKSFVSLIKKY